MLTFSQIPDFPLKTIENFSLVEEEYIKSVILNFNMKNYSNDSFNLRLVKEDNV